MRSKAFMSVLDVILSVGEGGKTLAERIQARIIEDLNEEKRKLQERGWSRYNLFSLDRRVSIDGPGFGSISLLIVLELEFRCPLSPTERVAVECLAYNCLLWDVGIWGKHEAFVCN